ncbi:transglycosylase SLT domain-containing protein [Pseudomonas sp. GL-B-16]|uniref:transglycosylase SLT domain-containing protein n=1 Tax=Pseudomonas sp. GL-B-16 TaxID=2832373 RepID=UPI001CBC4F24|nr:transglycosylase SLT domain-containing protein [Pseudomonas sp. GL-B-16]
MSVSRWPIQPQHMFPVSLVALITLCASCQAYLPSELPDARPPQLAIRTPHHLNPADRRRNDLPSFSQDTHTTLWASLGQGASLGGQIKDNDRIDTQRRWLIENRTFLTRASVRAAPYLYFIVHSVEQRGLPCELALLPMIESGYNPTAVSVRNAVGLWQFMPATATGFGLSRTAAYDGRLDVLASTSAALDYLERLHAQFDGDWLLALAAYNAGEGTVGRAIDANRRQGLPTDYWHLRLPRETTEYVPRLLALSALAREPLAHGINLEPVFDTPYFAKVPLPRAMDMKHLALATGLSERALRQLNPGYLGGTTQEGPGHILVPVSLQQPLIAMLDADPDSRRKATPVLEQSIIEVP